MNYRVLFLALLSLPAAAADFSSLTAQGYVSDFARVLDPAHRLEIERYARRVDALTGAEMAIVTIPTLDNEPIEDVANSLYRKWGIGKKGKNEGLLLLLVVNDRRMRLETGYGLEAIFPDGYAGELLDAMRPLLRQRAYGRGLLEAAHQIGTKIGAAKNITIDVSIPSRRPVRERASSWSPMLFPLVFLVLAIFFLSRRSGGRSGSSRGGYSRGYGAGPYWGGFGGGSSSSGGGFGGYDSSDSFGGFGGGDSGGGGSNSDW